MFEHVFGALIMFGVFAILVILLWRGAGNA
jgi:hypothetical protein